MIGSHSIGAGHLCKIAGASEVHQHERSDADGRQNAEQPLAARRFHTETPPGRKDGFSAQTYGLTRFAILRLLGLVYAVAFLVAANQILPLIGSDGLLPVGAFLDGSGRPSAGRRRASRGCPRFFGSPTQTVPWWRRRGRIRALLHRRCGICERAHAGGAFGCSTSPLSMSGRIGTDTGGIQLLETGFLAIFFCPLLDARPSRAGAPIAVIWLFRWLIFRIMLGAGLIKIRGDGCWRDLSALFLLF